MKKDYWISIILIIAWGIFIWMALASAHDTKRPDLDGWFNSLASKKGPCCSTTDGDVVKEPDWEFKDGHYRVFIDNQWIDVPDDAVLTMPNLYGLTMVWTIKGMMGISIRCFMRGAMM